MEYTVVITAKTEADSKAWLQSFIDCETPAAVLEHCTDINVEIGLAASTNRPVVDLALEIAKGHNT